ncbi:MAG: CotH kinase family protein [Polyangiaceae bacterium]|nr:CotH kinase family protein [Polyangiaceae bacterium]
MAHQRTVYTPAKLAPLGLYWLAFVACGGSGSDGGHSNDDLGGSGGAIAGAGAGGRAVGGQVGGGAIGEPDARGGNNGPAGSAGAFPGIDVPSVARDRIGDDVFDEDEVKSYYLELSEEEYARLQDFSTLLTSPWSVTDEPRYVEASLRVGDAELPSIGVRFKGNYSIWGCVDYATKQQISRIEPFFGNIDVCQRFSLKLDFDRYVDRFRLDGLKKLNLHAMAADPSKLRERLSYSLFREVDIVAPRAVHARVYINGEYQGLFAAVEQIDGRFTAHRFPEGGDGNLYRDLWPTADLSTADAQAALRTNDEPGVMDVSDFMAFRDAIAASTEEDFATRMAPHVDLDYLARYIVVDRAINSFDGPQAFYFGTGWGPSNQNYNWYDAGDGRFVLIPWDFDKAFWYPEPNFWSDNEANGENVVPNWNVVTSGCDGYECHFDAVVVTGGVRQEGSYHVRQIDCDPFLRMLRGEIYDRQRAIADAFIAGPFSEESVGAKLEAWRAQIADAIEEDPGVDSSHWQSSVDELLASLPSFQGNLNLMMNGLIDE